MVRLLCPSLNPTDFKTKFSTFLACTRLSIGSSIVSHNCAAFVRTRDQAEKFLHKSSSNSFLVRKSSSELGQFVLSYKRNDGEPIQHSLMTVRVIRRIDPTVVNSKPEEEYAIEVNGDMKTYPSVEFLVDDLDLDPVEADEDDEAFRAIEKTPPGAVSPIRVRRKLVAGATATTATTSLNTSQTSTSTATASTTSSSTTPPPTTATAASTSPKPQKRGRAAAGEKFTFTVIRDLFMFDKFAGKRIVRRPKPTRAMPMRRRPLANPQPSNRSSLIRKFVFVRSSCVPSLCLQFGSTKARNTGSESRRCRS